MALEKVTVVDKIEILEDGVMQVRKATRIIEDGEVLSQTFHRHILTPTDDVSEEDQRVKDIAGVVHTASVKAAWQAKVNENSPL